jgi:hypothetical protein
MAWKISIRHDHPLFDRATEKVGVNRLLFREDLVDYRAIVARWQACGVGGDRGKQLAAFAVGHQHHATLAILVEEALGDAAESLEVAIAQRIG